MYIPTYIILLLLLLYIALYITYCVRTPARADGETCTSCVTSIVSHAEEAAAVDVVSS